MNTKISEIINNRPVALVLQGKSVNELESRIQEFKDLNICWVALGLFTTIEEFILSKINKQLEIVFDCATVPESRLYSYETNERLPRLDRFLSRNTNNLWITSNGIIRDTIKGLHQESFFNKHYNKIFIVDNLFPKKNISDYMNVPNSAALFLGALISGNPKNIVIFGLDGYSGNVNEGINSYYRPQYASMERQNALGSISDEGISRDTNNFISKFPTVLKKYRKLFNNYIEIYNCSPNSLYKIPKNISYNEALKILR